MSWSSLVNLRRITSRESKNNSVCTTKKSIQLRNNDCDKEKNKYGALYHCGVSKLFLSLTSTPFTFIYYMTSNSLRKRCIRDYFKEYPAKPAECEGVVSNSALVLAHNEITDAMQWSIDNSLCSWVFRYSSGDN